MILPHDTLQTSPRPQVEVHGFLNVRYSSRSPWQLRLGVAVGWEPHESTYLGAGTSVTSSAGYVRLRVLPLSVDLGRNVGLRFGGDLGAQLVPSPGGGRVMFSAAGLGQLVGRTDDGRFEAGVHGGALITGRERRGRTITFSNRASTTTHAIDPVLGLTAGYLF